MQKNNTMKKIFSFVIASLLLLSAALPVAKAQTLISSLLPSSGCPKYPVQEIRALSIDVCKSPKIKQNGSVTSPNLSLSREAMIFGSINVTIGSYMNNFNGLSGVKGTWKLRVNMGDGTPWMTVPTAGTTLTANYPLGTNPKILYNAIVDRDTQLVGVCHNASKSFLTLTPYLVGL